MTVVVMDLPVFTFINQAHNDWPDATGEINCL